MTEQRAARGVVILVLVVGVIGAVNSVVHVANAVEPSFGYLAWTVPVGIDVGIAAFTGLDLLMARWNMRTRWLRLFPMGLVVVTVWVNVAADTTVIGQVTHGVLPVLWVVLVEAGSHVLRTLAGLQHPVERMDRVRVSRWLLAPVPTLLLWRRMVLWEVRSYTEALGRERDRVYGKCDLQDRYGRRWRRRATRRERAEYRLGELVPTRAMPAPPAPGVPGSSASNGDIVSAARAIADEETAAGRALSRRTLIAGLRDRGYPIGTKRAVQLLEEVAG